MPTETKVWKAIGGGGGSSKAKDTTTINIDSLQLKIVDVGNDDDDNDSSSDSDDELGALIYNSSNTAKKCREEAIKEDMVSIATTQAAEVGGGEKRTYDVSTFDDTMTSNVMDSRRLKDNTSSIATNKLQQNYKNNNTDIDNTNIEQKKKKQRYANEEIVKRLLAERELKRINDMKNKQQMRGGSSEEVVSMDIKSRDGQVSGGNTEDTNKNVNEKKKDTDQSPITHTPLIVPQVEVETENSSTSISEYVTAMNSIESMLSNQIKKEKERRSVGVGASQQSKKEDIKKSESEALLPSTPPRDFDWVSYYRQHHDKNTNKVSLRTTDKAKKQKKAAKEPPVIVTKRNYQQMGYHNYQIKDVKALKQMSTVVIPQPRPTRPQPQVNGRDWRSQHNLLRHHTPTHRQRTPYSQRYHPPTLHHASPPPYRQKSSSSSQPTRVHKKHTSPKYKTKRQPGRPKHGVSERKMLRGPPPVVHNGSPAWGRSKIDSRQDVVVDTRDDVEEDPRTGPSSLALKEAQSLLTKEARDTNKVRRRVGGLAKAKAQVWNRRIDLERQREDERYSMEAERLVKRAKQCEDEGNNEEQVRRVKELLEMKDDIKNLEKKREREEEQIRYIQMLAARELQRRRVIESKMNWM